MKKNTNVNKDGWIDNEIPIETGTEMYIHTNTHKNQGRPYAYCYCPHY